MTVNFHNNLSEFAGQFDAFIIDLWGVLHDGTAPYPGAVETLQNLRAADKKIILLSNAPRQAHKAEEVLMGLGFTKDLYDGILTSGQATHDYLAKNVEEMKTRTSKILCEDLATKGSGALAAVERQNINYYYIGPEKDLDLLEDLTNYTMVEVPAMADFVIATGFDEPGQPFSAKQEQIDACLANDLLLVCPNPDKKVVKQDGRTWLCPGLIADYYEERGGEVISFGKPYEAVYEKCFEMFGENIDKTKICGIGDSLHTDVAGANGFGIFSVLCAGGILAQELQIKPGEMPGEENLLALCQREKATPNAVVPYFIW